jgi:SPP1 gp7 family putative phage head morphogenesis protein
MSLLDRIAGAFGYTQPDGKAQQTPGDPASNEGGQWQFSTGYGPTTSRRIGTQNLLRGFEHMPWLHTIVKRIGELSSSVVWRVGYVTNVPADDGQGKRTPDAYERRALARMSMQGLTRIMQNADMAKRGSVLRHMVDMQAFEYLDGHPMLTALDYGNSQFNGRVGRELTQNYLDMAGCGGWILDKNRAGGPTGFWPVPPTWVVQRPWDTPDAAAKGEGTYMVRTPNGRMSEIPKDSFVWWHHPAPESPYERAVGTGHVLGDELETDEYAAKYMKQFFINRARPDLLIHGVNAQKEEMTRLEQKWLERLQGIGNMFKPYFLNRDVKVEVLSQNIRDMMMPELRQHERDMFMQVYGMPPEIFGILENSNRATIEAADYLTWKYVVIPRLEFQREILQWRLAPVYDKRLVVLYEAPALQDKEFLLNSMKASPWAYTFDEWRAITGTDPLPDKQGRVFAVPANTVVRATPMDESDDQENVDIEFDDDLPEEEEDDLEDVEDDTDPTEENPDEPNSKAAHLLRVKALDTKQKRLVAKVTGSIKSEPLVRRGKPIITETVEVFGQRMLDSLENPDVFNLADPQTTRFLRQWGTRRIKDLVDATTRRELRKTLVQGMNKGETLDELATRVRATFSNATGYRAELIARNEVARSSNWGSLSGIKQAGIEEKEWLAVMDARTREQHAGLDGAIVPVDDPFVVAGAKAQYPGGFGKAELDINCRCTVLAAIPTKMLKANDARIARWNDVEAARAPYDTALKSAMQRGFREQQSAALAALKG